jgi:hypothetical protein
MTEKAEDTERNTIKKILQNNEYNTNLSRKPPPTQKQNTQTLTPSTKKKNKMGYVHIQRRRSKKNY